MSRRRVHKICVCAVVVGVVMMIGIAPALGSLLATATISSVPNVSSDFDYTIILTNTGTVDIGTFWFAWTPPGAPTEYDFLPSLPSATSEPAGWIGSPSAGFPGNSIEYYNDTGSLITPGHTGTFGFTSSDDPNTLQTGVVFGFPMTTSFIYTGTPTELVNPPDGPTFQLTPTFVPAPEPSSLLILAGLGCTAAWCRRRRQASV